MSGQLFKFGLNKPKETEEKPKIVSVSNLEMTDAEFAEFRNEIYKLSGIYFTENKKYLLEGRIAKRIVANNLKSFSDYMRLIRGANKRDELERLYEAITINETYFYRAPQQFDVLEQIIVPEILEKRKNLTNQTFRIWSAASSSGEEAYTVALLILEKLKPKYPNVNFQVVGSDINQNVLDQARQGIYKEYAIRNVPKHLLSRYFKQDGNAYAVSPEVKRLVKFTSINLYDPVQVKMMSNCDVIFCANVLIYFDIPSKQQVVSHLYNALNKGGYLFIGYSESLHGISKSFKLVHLPKAMAYQKD
ncbi:MAG TPA: protein-glutamate O-methyltransferase CheR [Candidatus Kapabacteria bacterium]|nr:protein-glutamate O-methyltransferase CheR [Candidatus Kapabacteria bacterium]